MVFVWSSLTKGMGMKHLYMLVLVSAASAQAMECTTERSKTVIGTEAVTEPVAVPEHLKGSKIILVRADGRFAELNGEEYMVAKRVRRLVRERVADHTRQVCTPEQDKNIVSLGFRRDVTNASVRALSPNTGVLELQEGPVFDIEYKRLRIGNTPFNGGVGVDNRGTPKVSIGLGF